MGRRSKTKNNRALKAIVTVRPDIMPSNGIGRPVPPPYLCLLICGLLLASVLAVFLQTTDYPFVSFDDNDYIYANSHVREGLSAEGAAWAITAFEAHNWHPLTWLSHMLDCQIYGIERPAGAELTLLGPGGHHLTNVLFHAATAILLFLSLQRLTGALWPSAWVAAMFAVHPLRVESVAWAAERKDVLSGFFFMLTLWFYARYVERPTWIRYLQVFASFTLGLTAKPMLVTLPFVLLLLDYWPLRRLGVKTWKHALVEKIPLVVLAALSCAITVVAQRNAIRDFERVSFPSRMANAAEAYAAYIGKMLYPSDLAVLYPLAKDPPPALEVMAAVTLLAAVSGIAYALRRERPYLIVGWLWYLGTLAPVIGLVQVGDQKMADRYTYLTQIGLCISIAWLCADFAGLDPNRRRGFAIAGGAAVAICLVCAHRQTQHWRNSEALWNHTIACTSANSTAHTNLGITLLSLDRVDEAMDHFRTALQINPDNLEAHYNFGLALGGRGDFDEAIAHYRKAVAIKPDFILGRNNLGIALAERGHVDEAIEQYQYVLKINPDYIEALVNLGTALARIGQFDEAIVQFQKALKINPNYSQAFYNLGLAYGGLGRTDDAIANYRKAVEINPGYFKAHNNLGLDLAKRGEADEAIAQFRLAIEIDPNCFAAYNNLANALANKGQVDQAIACLRKVLALKPDYLDALNNLANYLFRQGRVDEAIGTYAKAIEFNPDFIEAHDNLGTVLASLDRRDQAMEHYRKALDLANARKDRALADAIQAKINAIR